MTIEQFDKIIGYLLEVMLPPNVSDDDPVTEGQLLDVLEQHCEMLKGRIIKTTAERGTK